MTDRRPDRLADILAELRSLAEPRNVEGMSRFGISPQNTLGISVTTLRRVARRIGRDHELALQLWDTGIHEARQLACLIDDPAKATKRQLERWVRDVDSWDVCDGFAWGFVDGTPYAVDLAMKWSTAKAEFVKRAGFAIMAGMAVHDKTAADETLLQFLPVIRREAGDDRNYVKKAVNWALRQIGKRNPRLNAAAIETAEQIRADGTRAGRWIASDALRELRSDAVQARLRAGAARPAVGRRR